jgi:hypothetical protein
LECLIELADILQVLLNSPLEDLDLEGIVDSTHLTRFGSPPDFRFIPLRLLKLTLSKAGEFLMRYLVDAPALVDVMLYEKEDEYEYSTLVTFVRLAPVLRRLCVAVGSTAVVEICDGLRQRELERVSVLEFYECMMDESSQLALKALTGSPNCPHHVGIENPDVDVPRSFERCLYDISTCWFGGPLAIFLKNFQQKDLKSEDDLRLSEMVWWANHRKCGAGSFVLKIENNEGQDFPRTIEASRRANEYRENWIRVCVLIAFMRANAGHYFERSLIPLLTSNVFGDFLEPYYAVPRYVNFSKLSDSRFVRSNISSVPRNVKKRKLE